MVSAALNSKRSIRRGVRFTQEVSQSRSAGVDIETRWIREALTLKMTDHSQVEAQWVHAYVGEPVTINEARRR
jgi:hypothetical protein